MKALFAGAALLAVATTAVPASAAVTGFTDRTLFVAAAGPLTTETFNSCAGGSSVGTNVSLSSANPGPCGSIVAGVTFSPPAGFDNYIAPAGQSANPTIALGVDYPPGGVMTVSFSATDIFAIGADLFQNNGGGSQSGSASPFEVTVNFVGGSSQVFDFGVPSDTGGFFGLTSTQAIQSVGIAETDGFAVIDNASFSGSAGVPEPASWAMMLVGFGGLGAVLRRNRAAMLAA
jgi:hypothetical protein